MSARAYVAALGLLWTVPGLPTCLNVYRSDVERICDAESRSGKKVKTDAAGVMSWLEHNVASGQGIVFEGQLASESPRDRAVHLRAEARGQSIAACPLADAFEAFAVADDYRSAIVSLCDGEAVTEGGGVARLDVAPADDAERMREIRDWTLTVLKGSEALAFVDKMAQTAVQARPAMLRAEAGRLGIPTCALATTLEHPPPTPIPLSLVALPSFTVSRVDGAQRVQEAITGTLSSGNAGQTIDNCYGQALVKTPTLAGNVALRFTFDPNGKVTRAEESSSSLGSAAVVKCITSGLVGEVLAPAEKGGAKYTAVLALTPYQGSRPAGWPTVMPRPAPAALPGTIVSDAGAPDSGRRKKR